MITFYSRRQLTLVAFFESKVEWHRIVAVFWTGIMTTVVAIYLEGFALQVASATEAALTFASEPVWASLFGAWLLGEQLGPTSYVGGGIILFACVIGALADLPAFAEEEQEA
jgi:drug/metabolite transporter (DMT)-like permease